MVSLYIQTCYCYLKSGSMMCPRSGAENGFLFLRTNLLPKDWLQAVTKKVVLLCMYKLVTLRVAPSCDQEDSSSLYVQTCYL